MSEADMVAKVSIINMKGGVGKSTLCTQLAWHFSAKWGWDKRVPVIDLDPQFNASQYVLGVQRYQHDVIDADRPTVWDIFEQASRTPGLKSSGRSLSNAVLNVVSYHDGARLDIIASQLELSYTLKNPNQKEHLLSAFVDSIEDNYDLILVDCAPTESVAVCKTRARNASREGFCMSSLRAKRSHPFGGACHGLLRRYAPRNDEERLNTDRWLRGFPGPSRRTSP
jgi:cellulose biosynthesis protein BcsQ